MSDNANGKSFPHFSIIFVFHQLQKSIENNSNRWLKFINPKPQWLLFVTNSALLQIQMVAQFEKCPFRIHDPSIEYLYDVRFGFSKFQLANVESIHMCHDMSSPKEALASNISYI